VITYVGFRVIEGLIARIPRRLAYALGVVISTLAFPLLARQRKALESNLRQVCPELPAPQIRHRLPAELLRHPPGTAW